MTFCEAAAYYKSQGITLYEQLQNMFKKYGYFKENLKSATLKGMEGMAKIKEIMQSYRMNAPKVVGGMKVLELRDYKEDIIKNLESGEIRKTGLPNSDVLYFDLEDDAWCAIRPSGTEPKIKFYFGVKGKDEEDAKQKLDILMNDPVFDIQ